MSVMAPVPKDSPLMVAWEKHKASDDYRNSKRWVIHGAISGTDENVTGTLWALFVAGWTARDELGKATSEGESR